MWGQCNILHLNTTGIVSLWRLFRAHRRGIKVVSTAHTVEGVFRGSFILSSGGLAPGMYRRFLSRFYNSVDCVVAPTEHVKSLLTGSEYRVNKPISVISNGVDFAGFNSQPEPVKLSEAVRMVNGCKESKNVVTLNSTVILCVGMWATRKGILEFVELAKRMPDFEFVWVGKTSPLVAPRAAIRLIRNSNEIRNVHFVGYVAHKDIAAFYHLASAFLFLTHDETEGLVVLEALASGTPVIVSDIPVFDGWLRTGKNCYKVPALTDSYDEEEFYGEAKRALEMAVDKKRNNQLISQGMRVAKQRDMGVVGEQLHRLYLEVLLGG